MLHIHFAMPFFTCDYCTLSLSHITTSASQVCTLNLLLQRYLLSQLKLDAALTLMLCYVCTLLQTASAAYEYSHMI